ncbi:MAG: DUF262 domain-containing protein [Pseudonocardiaceae bacterium]|nr:DUF262 domain-containing protein [Pseudonocardiaceae bacterium]
MAKLGTILDQIDAGSMLLPEFQRGYVWNRDQVRALMRSMYLEHPVGALLIWETDGGGHAVRGTAEVTTGPKQLLLDGQQRVTTLYGIVRGRPPSFFEGDASAFAGLRFNVETEAFQFYAPVKMKDDPLWIDVTALFVDGPASQYAQLHRYRQGQQRFGVYVERLTRLHSILQREFHAERITGADKSVDVVVDIFNRVNSGGTKLSKGDLALAKICAEWGDARPTMRQTLQSWQARDYHFTLDWLLRNVNAVATGRASFSALDEVDAAEFEKALLSTTTQVEYLLGLAGGRLGLDHDRVLMGRYAFPVLTRLLHLRGGQFADDAEADRALFWCVHAALRGRFAGSTETVLTKDLETVERSGVDGLIAALRRARGGNLSIESHDFESLGRGSRFYPLLYLLTRVRSARDLASGVPLGEGTVALQVHEIFPKAQLYKHGYSRSEVNAIANFAFVVPSTGSALGRREPVEYLGECHPAALRSQWIPDDPALWRLENYREFLAARRELLAAAANELLDQLQGGRLPWAGRLAPVAVSPGDEGPDAKAAQVRSLLDELADLGYATPAVDAEIADPETGRVLAVAEGFWPDGLQVGQGPPVVLELDPEEADLDRLSELGCEVFTSVDALRGFVQRRSRAESGEAGDVDPRGEAERDDEPTTEPATADLSFDRAVLELVDRCRAELSYNPRYFRVMITQHGTLGAARRLLAAPAVSDGFVRLWEKQRLDLSVESLATDERFAHLFTEQEQATARQRLDDFGYGPAAA